MICQPVGEKDSKDQDGEEVVSDGGSGDEARRSSLGKRKRKVDRNPPGPIRSGKQSAGKRATPEQEWEARREVLSSLTSYVSACPASSLLCVFFFHMCHGKGCWSNVP